MSRKAVTQAMQRLQSDYQSALLDLHAQRTPEALHNLRISLRRARSLLAPMRKWPGVVPLYQRLGEVADASSALRDQEVLLQELNRKQHSASDALLSHVQQSRAAFLSQEALYELSPAFRQWQELKRSQRMPTSRLIKRHLQTQQDKWLSALKAEQEKAAPDRHVIRLLVKRLRYTVATYPKTRPGLSALEKQLKKVQALLGDWHDREVWEAAGRAWPELAPLLPAWQEERARLAAAADAATNKLLKALSTRKPKKK